LDDHHRVVIGRHWTTIVGRHRSVHKIEGPDGEIEPVRPLKHASRLRDGGDRQSIPIRQNLIIASWPDAALAQREQGGAVSRQRRLGLLIQQLD
jgi:hypothetical protein